jgi:hypothetical protein
MKVFPSLEQVESFACHLRHRDSSILVVGALSEPYRNPLYDGFTLIDFQGGGLRDIGSELGAESCHVVGEDRGLVASARDGDVGEAVQLRKAG